jgi:hypothetical protein
MNITVHADGTAITIKLTYEQCTSTTWGAFCQDVVNNYLMADNARLMLQILTNISPNERLPHYVFRFGDGYSSIIRVNWSSAGVPGFKRVPLATGYIEVNVILKPVGSGAPTNMAKPHLPVRPAGANVPSSIDVDLCISVVSAHPSDDFLDPTTQQPPFPSNIARTSLVYLTENKRVPGWVDSFSIVAADGVNNLLPGNARMPPDAPSAAAEIAAAEIAVATAETTATNRRKRKAAPQIETAPAQKKSKVSKKKKEDTPKTDDDDGAKKPAAKAGKGKGGAAAAAKKKSPPEESAAKTKSPPKKSGRPAFEYGPKNIWDMSTVELIKDARIPHPN